MKLFNVEDPGTGRQANNLLATAVVDAVRPWFADVADQQRIKSALSALGSTDRLDRQWAQEVLGVKIRPAA